MKIAQYLKNSGLTWEQFADKCGISRQTVYLLMKGKQNPTLNTIDKITKASGGDVTIGDLRK